MSEALSSNDAAPRPRLCHLRKWPDFNGYGFNLHAERGKAGQFIGNVDPDSPAVAANLRPGDRIVQVGYVYMSAMTHVTKMPLISHSQQRGFVVVRAALTGKHDTLVRRAPGWQGAPDGQRAKKNSCYKMFILL